MSAAFLRNSLRIWCRCKEVAEGAGTTLKVGEDARSMALIIGCGTGGRDTSSQSAGVL